MVEMEKKRQYCRKFSIRCGWLSGKNMAGKGKTMNFAQRSNSLKKWTAGSFFLLSLFFLPTLSAEERILSCQMLLSEAEQRELGFARQRAMYVPSRAKRLAMMSLRDGSAFLRKEELAKAMEELNRTWRFDPSNPYSFWLAGIVRSMEAARLTNSDLRKKMLRRQSETL